MQQNAQKRKTNLYRPEHKRRYCILMYFYSSHSTCGHGNASKLHNTPVSHQLVTQWSDCHYHRKHGDVVRCCFALYTHIPVTTCQQDKVKEHINGSLSYTVATRVTIQIRQHFKSHHEVTRGSFWFCS